MAIGIVFRFVIAVDALGNPGRAFVESIQRVGAEAVIPSRKNRQQPRPLDRHIYKDRNLVERFFQKLKQFRRIATRYERLAKKLPVDVEFRISSHLAGIIENAPYSIKWALCGCWSIYPRPFFDGYPPNRHAAKSHSARTSKGVISCSGLSS
jgi:hypothetical protein